jgi:hypothetical protein
MNNTQKLLEQIKKVYSTCIITKTTNNVNLQSIIPTYLLSHSGTHLLYSKYLHIPLSNNLINDFQNFRITIYPEPTTIFYENINNKIIKGGIFRAYDIYNNCINVVLLYNTRVFLKYHFLKFLETNKINPTIFNYQDKYISSELYLNRTIYEISRIDNENIFDYSGNNIMAC